MKYDLQALEDLSRDGYLRKVVSGDLVLFNYTDKTTFERAWQTRYTRDSRGLILNKNTGETVAKCLPKFHNLGEMESVSLLNLPKEEYRVFEKCDGSLGIIYFYDNQWNMATRGSFSSEQAVRGLSILKKNYNLNKLHPQHTYLVEIIYPENKIIVDYGDSEKLVMLASYHTSTGDELGFDTVKAVADSMGMESAKEFKLTIEEMIALQKTLPKNDEGFVVRFAGGTRVKIKGDEYMRIAKMISQMSPLSFWEAMKDGTVGREYVMQLPEEFRKEYEPMIDKLEDQYKEVIGEIRKDFENLPKVDFSTKEGKKILGLLVQGKEHGLKHPSAMFPIVLTQHEALEKYVMRAIRPTGNAFVSLE